MASSCGRVRGEEDASLRACGVEHSMMHVEQGREIKEVRDVPTRAYGKASAARGGAFLVSEPAISLAPPATRRAREIAASGVRGARRKPAVGARRADAE